MKELTVQVNPLELDNYLRPDIIVVDRMRAAGFPVIGLGAFQGVTHGNVYSKLAPNGDLLYLWSDK